MDYYEAEVTLDELAAMIFEDLGLPYLEEKKLAEMETRGGALHRHAQASASWPTWTSGARSWRTSSATRRRATPTSAISSNDDLRFKTWEPTIKYQSNAVVIAMMDVSGSMGEFEKYIARSFYFWMVRFLRTKYKNVKIVFISHHTEAKEVTEEEFFNHGESGGTQVSSAYELALRDHRRALQPRRLEHLPVPLLRRRQPALG